MGTNESSITYVSSAGMDGAELIAAERQRQIQGLGWSLAHDRRYVGYELLRAAICYAQAGLDLGFGLNATAHPPGWPVGDGDWGWEWWKPDNEDPIRNLVKAGALIAAEIDRLRGTRPELKCA